MNALFLLRRTAIPILLFLGISFFAKAQSPSHKIWDYDYGGNSYEMLSGLLHTREGGFLLTGWTLSDAGYDISTVTRGQEDFWIVKLDSMGLMKWEKRYGGADDENLRYSQQTTDGGYILAGLTLSGAGGDISQPKLGIWDFWVIKID